VISCDFAYEPFVSVHAINWCTVRATASTERIEVRTKYFDSKILEKRQFGDLGIDREIILK
jgi:hypothetical protein